MGDEYVGKETVTLSDVSIRGKDIQYIEVVFHMVGGGTNVERIDRVSDFLDWSDWY